MAEPTSAKIGRHQFSWWIRDELGDRLTRYAERNNRFQREVVEAALEMYLDEAEKKKPTEVVT